LLDGPGRRTARVGQVITSDLYVVQDVDGPLDPEDVDPFAPVREP